MRISHVCPHALQACSPALRVERQGTSVSESHNAAEASGVLAQQRSNAMHARNLAAERINEMATTYVKRADGVSLSCGKVGSIINDWA